MKTYTGTTARERLNSAKVMAPLLAAVVGTVPEEKQLRTLQELGLLVQTIAQNVVRKLVLPEDRKACLEAVTADKLSPLLASVWKQAPGKSLSHYQQVVEASFLGLVDILPPTPQTVFENLPRTTDEELTHARMMAKFLPLVMQLDELSPSSRNLVWNGHNRETFLACLKQTIVDRAESIARELEPYQDKERFISYKSTLNTLSEITSAALEQGYADMRRYFNAIRTDPQKQKAYLARLQNDPSCPLLNKVNRTLDLYVPTLFPGVELENAPAVNF